MVVTHACRIPKVFHSLLSFTRMLYDFSCRKYLQQRVKGLQLWLPSLAVWFRRKGEARGPGASKSVLADTGVVSRCVRGTQSRWWIGLVVCCGISVPPGRGRDQAVPCRDTVFAYSVTELSADTILILLSDDESTSVWALGSTYSPSLRSQVQWDQLFIIYNLKLSICSPQKSHFPTAFNFKRGKNVSDFPLENTKEKSVMTAYDAVFNINIAA